jgi:Predicted metal-binding protein
MKNNYEKMGYKEEFDEYYGLFISPMHVHKSKDEHEKAIFVLSSTLSMIVAEENEIYQISKLKEKSVRRIE